MKKRLNSNFLSLAALAAGLAGCTLRRGLYAVAVDEKNLLTAMHPMEIALWVLIAATAVLVITGVRKWNGSEDYGDNFGPSVWAAIGSLAMAAGILFTVLTLDSTFSGPIGKLWKLTGFLSAPALAAVALFRLKGKQPVFMCHFVTCLFFVLYLVSQYQSWSSNPQLQDYFFSLGGGVLMTLFAFYQTAFDVGSGQRRLQLITGLLGGIFCLTALAQTEIPVLYLTGGIWMLTGLCRAEAVPEQEEDHGTA